MEPHHHRGPASDRSAEGSANAGTEDPIGRGKLNRFNTLVPSSVIRAASPPLLLFDVTFLLILRESLAVLREHVGDRTRKKTGLTARLAESCERRALDRLGMASAFRTPEARRPYAKWLANTVTHALHVRVPDPMASRPGMLGFFVRELHRGTELFSGGTMDLGEVRVALSMMGGSLSDADVAAVISSQTILDRSKSFLVVNARGELEPDKEAIRDAFGLRRESRMRQRLIPFKPAVHDSIEHPDDPATTIDHLDKTRAACAFIEQQRRSATESGDAAALAALEFTSSQSTPNSMPELAKKYGVSVKVIRTARQKLADRFHQHLRAK